MHQTRSRIDFLSSLTHTTHTILILTPYDDAHVFNYLFESICFFRSTSPSPRCPPSVVITNEGCFEKACRQYVANSTLGHLPPTPSIAIAALDMASPIVRKKRNFKALQLDVSNPAPAPPPVPVPVPAIATRLAPSAPGGRRKPPAMDLSKSKVVPAPVQDKVESPGLLSVAAPSNSAPTSAASASAQRSTYHHKLTDHLASLEISNPETKLDLCAEDLKNIGELGAGNGGTVNKVEHVPTKTIMAKKVCIQGYLILKWDTNSTIGGAH